jgi:hypothetical protein
VSQMVKVSIEVHSGSARFWVSVQAQSVQQATSIVAGRYPSREANVRFLTDPEDCFVGDSVVRIGR